MRRSLILGLCIVLCCAVFAQAALIDVTDGTNTYTGVLSYTRTVVNGSLDLLTITCNNLAAMYPTNTKLQVFQGEFTSTGTLSLADNSDPNGDGYYIPWVPYASKNEHSIADANHWSYVNIAYTDGAEGSIPWTETSNSLYGMWSSSSGPTNGVVLAKMYVGTGNGLTFIGSWYDFINDTYPGGWGFNNSVAMEGGFTIAPVPEPSMMVLAASGLIGLLCYAWRKRR